MCDLRVCYANSYAAAGVVMAVPLLAVYTSWLLLPRDFRQQRPLVLRVAMGGLACGTFHLVAPMCEGLTIEQVDCALRFGLQCAGALGLLMVFELIAYLRRPSSFPHARVTHGA